jgi:hypothetical protein
MPATVRWTTKFTEEEWAAYLVADEQPILVAGTLSPRRRGRQGLIFGLIFFWPLLPITFPLYAWARWREQRSWLKMYRQQHPVNR